MQGSVWSCLSCGSMEQPCPEQLGGQPTAHPYPCPMPAVWGQSPRGTCGHGDVGKASLHPSPFALQLEGL